MNWETLKFDKGSQAAIVGATDAKNLLNSLHIFAVFVAFCGVQTLHHATTPCNARTGHCSGRQTFDQP